MDIRPCSHNNCGMYDLKYIFEKGKHFAFRKYHQAKAPPPQATPWIPGYYLLKIIFWSLDLKIDVLPLK